MIKMSSEIGTGYEWILEEEGLIKRENEKAKRVGVSGKLRTP